MVFIKAFEHSGFQQMKCWYCFEGQMIWGGDHDIEDNDTYDFETNFTCNNEECNAVAIFYHKKDSSEND